MKIKRLVSILLSITMMISIAVVSSPTVMASSTAVSSFGDYDKFKSGVELFENTQDFSSLANLIIDSSPAGVVKVRLQNDYTQLWNQLAL